MKYKKNKRYRLFEYEPRCGMIYIKVENGQIYFYNCRNYWEDDKKWEIKWIEQGFADCKLLFRSDELGSDRDFCYLILKENLSRGHPVIHNKILQLQNSIDSAKAKLKLQ